LSSRPHTKPNNDPLVQIIALMKPAAKAITRIDLGVLTYEQDMLESIKRAKMLVERNEIIDGSIDTHLQAARLVVVNPT